MRISGDIIDMSGKDNRFLKDIITGEETWCFLYDLQTQRQSEQKSSLSTRGRNFQVDRGKERLFWKFVTGNSFSILSSSLKVKL